MSTLSKLFRYDYFFHDVLLYPLFPQCCGMSTFSIIRPPPCSPTEMWKQDFEQDF